MHIASRDKNCSTNVHWICITIINCVQAFNGFGFGDAGFQMSFGIGAFPFGLFASVFNVSDGRPPARMYYVLCSYTFTFASQPFVICICCTSITCFIFNFFVFLSVLILCFKFAFRVFTVICCIFLKFVYATDHLGLANLTTFLNLCIGS